mmetsp:Transcript_3622/g.5151  ORF Transcript_3622/g.5151 Transcript_3622/m.5151 type:complete len:325 (-) Transcript_3622:291-1265(-)
MDMEKMDMEKMDTGKISIMSLLAPTGETLVETCSEAGYLNAELKEEKIAAMEVSAQTGGFSESQIEDSTLGVAKTSAFRSAQRREWNLKHSRRSRQKVAHALKQLTRSCNRVASVGTLSQAEVMHSASQIIDTLRRDNRALQAQVELLSEWSRNQIVSDICREQTSPTDALVSFSRRVQVAWKSPLLEIWTQTSDQSGASRVASVSHMDFENAEGNGVSSPKTDKLVSSSGLPFRVLHSKQDEWMDSQGLLAERPELRESSVVPPHSVLCCYISLQSNAYALQLFLPREPQSRTHFLRDVKMVIMSFSKIYTRLRIPTQRPPAI